MKDFIDSIYKARECKGAGSKAAKREAISNWDSVGKRLCREALSPYRVFGLKQIPKNIDYMSDEDGDTGNVEDFFELLDKLHNRELTGHAARDAVVAHLSLYTARTAEILRCVIDKNLRAGFSPETVNEIYTGEKEPLDDVAIVPVYSVMLARKLEKEKDIDWDEPKICEAKYDGQRANLFIENGNASFKARSGKPMDHLDGLFDEKEFELIHKHFGDVMIDGEMMAGSFTETMNAKSSKNDDAKQHLKFYVYDIVPIKEFFSHEFTETQYVRSKVAATVKTVLDMYVTSGELTAHKFENVETAMVSSYKEAKQFYEKCVDKGYEGIIIKDPNAVYERDRSKSWWKWKPVATYDARIVSLYKGRPKSRLENVVAGFYAEGVDENGVHFKCRCGSGLNDKMRQEMTDNPDDFIDKTVEIEADPEMSVSNGEYSLRWPIFKKVRSDK